MIKKVKEKVGKGWLFLEKFQPFRKNLFDSLHFDGCCFSFNECGYFRGCRPFL